MVWTQGSAARARFMDVAPGARLCEPQHVAEPANYQTSERIRTQQTAAGHRPALRCNHATVSAAIPSTGHHDFDGGAGLAVLLVVAHEDRVVFPRLRLAGREQPDLHPRRGGIDEQQGAVGGEELAEAGHGSRQPRNGGGGRRASAQNPALTALPAVLA